jgi:predicted Zn-dependent protease
MHSNRLVLLLNQNQFGPAEQSGLVAVEILRELVKESPDDPHYAVILGNTCRNLAILKETRNRPPAEILKWSTQAIDELERVLRMPNAPASTRATLVSALGHHANTLARAGRGAEAVKSWDRVAELSPGPPTPLRRLGRAYALAVAGDHARGTAEASELTKSDRTPPVILDSAARVYSKAVAAARKDARLSPAERARLTEGYTRRACELLRRLSATNYYKRSDFPKLLQENDDFEPLRGQEEFKKLLAEVSQDQS